MRLHTLRMLAVGPFADEQVIDFDRLGAGGLFLFEGPTGVGKSTILDALTFALYGGIASESGDPARMRSDFADSDVRPEVCLEFSARGTRHRITRSPEFTRPKRRGSGVVKEHASVHLERLAAGGWESRSHAKQEAGTLVGELLGLTREQFGQVALLPQGEFATFLRAGDDERRDVLDRLFGTQLFRRVTASLQARAQDSARLLAAADADLRARVAAACEAAGLERAATALISERPIPEQLDNLAALDVGLAQRVQDASESATLAGARVVRARAELSDAQEVRGRVTRRGTVVSMLAAAELEQPDHDARREALAAALRAVPVGPLVELVDLAEERVAALRYAVSDSGACEGTPAGSKHLRGEGWQSLAGQAAAARTEAGGLAHVVLIEEGLVALRKGLAEQRSAAACLLDSLRLAEERGEHLPGELTVARAALASARQEAASAAGTRAHLAAVAGPAAAAERVAGLSDLVDQRRVARRRARRAYEQANDDHDLLVGERLTDVRGELAAQLVSGDPCLVCGSPDHPSPASSVGRGVSDVQVRDAANRRDECRLVLDQAELALVRAESDLEQARRASDGRSAGEWQARIAELGDQLATAELADEAVGGLAAREADLLAEQAVLSSELVRVTGDHARAHAAAEHCAKDLAERVSLVATASAGFGSVRERAAALVADALSLDVCSQVVQDLGRAIEELARASGRACQEASAAGFTDLPEARCALLGPDGIEALAQQVEEWESAVAAAREQLGSEELRSVAGLDPGWAAEQAHEAGERLVEAEESARHSQGELSIAGRQRDRFAERMGEVVECAAQRAAISASGEELVALDQYARGLAGTPRMTLVTFVLRYWFEQVVAAANVRLESMSSGKYELLRIDQGPRRDARVGLGLAVLDRHTGRERSTGTLSGGETFYTSLALALGLADVVVAQAGGAQLDTLFIDEGFGSLDADTLDDVMGVIDELRGHGRVIGIVSHVPELKERIAERLSVRRISLEGPSMVEVRA